MSSVLQTRGGTRSCSTPFHMSERLNWNHGYWRRSGLVNPAYLRGRGFDE